jgi:hypothetical protein
MPISCASRNPERLVDFVAEIIIVDRITKPSYVHRFTTMSPISSAESATQDFGDLSRQSCWTGDSLAKWNYKTSHSMSKTTHGIKWDDIQLSLSRHLLAGLLLCVSRSVGIWCIPSGIQSFHFLVNHERTGLRHLQCQWTA